MLGYIVGLMSYKESRGNMPARKEIEERNYYMKLPYIFIYSDNHCKYYYHYYYHYHYHYHYYYYYYYYHYHYYYYYI